MAILLQGEAPLPALIVAIVWGTLASVGLLVQSKSSKVAMLKRLRAEKALVMKRNDALEKENMSLRSRLDFVRTELNKVDEELKERTHVIAQMSRANDDMRRQVARMRLDLEHEKRRSDELFGRVAQLLAEQNRLDELLGNQDNITG